MGNRCYLFLLVLVCLCSKSQSFSWPFSSSSAIPPSHGGPKKELFGTRADFSIEAIEDPKGMRLVEDAKKKLVTSNSCWQNAYRNLFSGCKDIIADKDKRSRLAWHLSDCFQEDSGRSNFPTCDAGTAMMKCLKKLDESEYNIYLQFFLETNSICHQLQTEAFKHDTERLINDLSESARFAEDQLVIIEERSEKLLHDSKRVHDSLTSIDLQTQNIAQASKDVEAQLHDVEKHSVAIIEQSRGIAESQLEIQTGYLRMNETLESGMAQLHKSHESLGDGLARLRDDATKIESEIEVLRESMSSRMQDLQRKANDIGEVAGMSLEKQKRLLDGQSRAIEGLDFLTRSQYEAIKESRENVEKLAELGHRQQKELLRRQEEIQQAHDRLLQNSQSILAAQEEFELKQANIFAALDKLFALHNALLVESRFIKSFFFYSSVIFLLYMLTSAKQTFGIRARLYLGLCITFMIEIAIIRFGEDDFNRQTWIMSKIFLARSTFLVAAAVQILHSIFTFRDYEVLNHQLLQTLVEKVHNMEQNSGNKFLSYSMESDTDLSRYSWIDEELPEDVDVDVDPNYALPEEVAENSITTTSVSRKYDLRPRRCR
ncbi:protein GAMETE EXPRESSED 1 [Phoenix dactylifera]|uniref:Protein GAMETE EXPRESSED 1 n=1 Tax=Phoenix dactylifera TaxID=42345 RepID=A0A8B9AHZ1_PHODC|nr:protein GAMETE EXPRESSED 1 [Phoenix dactylifera]